MRVLVIPASFGNVHPMNIAPKLSSMQALVGGLIQTAPDPVLNEMGIELIVNEEGLLKGLAPNENLWPFFYVGQAFMVGTDGEDFTSLTDGQMLFAKDWIADLRTLDPLDY